MSEIKVNSVVNSTGDNDSGLDLATNDQVKVKIANAEDFIFKANSLEVQTGSNIDMNGTELILDADGDTSIEASTDDTIVFDTAGSERVRITSTGDVGIGDASPESNTNFTALTVTSTASTGGGQVYVQSSSVSSVFGADNTSDPKSILQTVTNHPLTLGTNNTERMRIRSDGVIVLGSCAINASSTTVASRGSRFAINQGNSTGFGIAIDNIRNDTSSSGGILITNNETSGTFDALSFLNSSNQEIGKINTSNGSTSYSTSSDYRLKENVVTDWDATSRIKKLKPSRFNFKTDKDTTLDGFLAHEVSSIVPEAIIGEKDAVDEDGNIKPQSIDQSKLVPLLVKTIQELEARITALESK
tara:strand:+ start:60 stop:1136 length:1077 start_codon:yes stop_codon:yes gene_type:complete